MFFSQNFAPSLITNFYYFVVPHSSNIIYSLVGFDFQCTLFYYSTGYRVQIKVTLTVLYPFESTD